MARFVRTACGLEVRGKPTVDEWLAEGRQLAADVKKAMFRLGDWLNFGERSYGEMYAQGMAITGLSYKTLANAAWTSREIESCRREEGDVPVGRLVHHRLLRTRAFVEWEQVTCAY